MPQLQPEHPARNCKAHHPAPPPGDTGFTLLEMSIIIAIIAVIVAGTLSMGNSMIASAKVTNTNNKLDAIEKALMAYRLANDRLPCPTDPTWTDTLNSPTYSSSYGYEVGTPGYCDVVAPDPINPNISTYTIPTHSNNGSATIYTTNLAALGMSVAEGAVPVKTLGLPDEFQFDGWGRKFAYAVATAMTYAPTSTNLSAAYVKPTSPTIPAITAGSPSPAFVDYGAQANCGAITVQNGALPNHTNITQVADYALLSYGPNGHGGYLKSGVQYFMGSSNLDELANCHCNADGSPRPYTGTYVQQDQTQTDSSKALTVFDDIVRYKERGQMMNDYDLYHLGSQLPCTNGFQVQGMGINNTRTSIATGDINGDGIVDLVIGVGSKVWVVFGTRYGFPDPLPLASLNGSNGFTLNGSAGGSVQKYALATGDVNGDGFADLIIGMSPQVYVVFGGQTGANDSKDTPWASCPCTLGGGAGSLTDGTQGIEFDVGNSFGWLGTPVTAGDINGDSYADIIISSIATGSSIGDYYKYDILFGRKGTWPGDGSGGTGVYNLAPGGVLINGTQGIELDGNEANTVAVSVVTTGDVNGDGVSDLIIGLSSDDGDQITDYTYVVFGKSTPTTRPFLSGLSNTTITNNANSSTITPLSYNGLMVGQTLAAHGLQPGTVISDCNSGNQQPGTPCTSNITIFPNTTVANLPTAPAPLTIVTTPIGTAASGSIIGSITGPGTLIDGTKGVRFDDPITLPGVTSYDAPVGVPVAAGDVNGDGLADIILGAAGSDVYVVFGKSTSWGAAGNVSLALSTDSIATDNIAPGIIDGIRGVRFDNTCDPGDFTTETGYMVATGDVNGDGYADVLMASYAYPTTHIYVVFGRSVAWPGDGLGVGTPCSLSVPSGTYNMRLGGNSIINGTQGVRLDGTNWFNEGLATGDINGDGIPDIIIGAPLIGAVYIYNGRANGWPNPNFDLGGL